MKRNYKKMLEELIKHEASETLGVTVFKVIWKDTDNQTEQNEFILMAVDNSCTDIYLVYGFVGLSGIKFYHKKKRGC